MSRITHIDRDTCKTLRDRVASALQPLATELGVDITAGNIRFTASNLRIQIEIATKSDDGTTLTTEATAFRDHAKQVGLDPGMLGKTFHCGGRQFIVRGLNLKAWAKPILAEELSSGKRYKFTADAVATAMTTPP